MSRQWILLGKIFMCLWHKQTSLLCYFNMKTTSSRKKLIFLIKKDVLYKQVEDQVKDAVRWVILDAISQKTEIRSVCCVLLTLGVSIESCLL